MNNSYVHLPIHNFGFRYNDASLPKLRKEDNNIEKQPQKGVGIYA